MEIVASCIRELEVLQNEVVIPHLSNASPESISLTSLEH